MSVAPRNRRQQPGAPGGLWWRRRRWDKLWRLALVVVGVMGSMPAAARQDPRSVLVGAEVLAAGNFAMLAGKRIGLIANQTSLAYGEHLADLLQRTPGIRLAAILAPEHGFRGAVEAGAPVGTSVDQRTGVTVYSLYGRSKKPSPAMLRGLDLLLFDIQDIGTRYYTYISTLGLAMQAAAAARIPFIVLDRPNPLGGEYVSGFVLEPSLRSFVGQYPMPIAHGMTVGEIARMIKGEGWLAGLEHLDLSVVALEGWRRQMRWPQTERPWVPTSPNIPSFASALLYPGIGLVGELDVNEGRGTASPFATFAAPWLKSERLLARLKTSGLAGVEFEPASYVPISIAGVAKHPRFVGQRVHGVRLLVSDAQRIEPLEVGIYVLAALMAEARASGHGRLVQNLAMFHALAGSKRLYRLLQAGSDGKAIVAAWQSEVAQFKDRRAKYLLY
jgi:uncharacterized protein YbbC (DUF1343 family)